MKLSELFGRAKLPYSPELGDIEIKNIVTDSRRVTDGDLFLCIAGGRSDGHRFAEDAIRRGARVIVAERVREACVGGAAAWIVLENTRRASALLYNALYGDPCAKLKIIGVTGTNGKTSTCVLLYRIFEAAGIRSGLIGTLGCFSTGGRKLRMEWDDEHSSMTTPDPEYLYAALARMAEEGVETVFMEVSSHALASDRVAAITFQTAVFTNLTRDHLDFHGDMESYYLAKKKLFEQTRRAVIWQDDPYGRRLLQEINIPAITCSGRVGDFCAQDIEFLGTEGCRYRLKTPKGDFSLSLGMAGEFAVINSLLASAVALESGISPEALQDALSRIDGVEGRMERVEIDPRYEFSVWIDYAHTPDALEKLLKSARVLQRGTGRLLLLFGCGGDRDRGKRKEMGRIASRFADFVIVTSDNSRSEDPDAILSDVVRGIDKEKEYSVIRDRREAIRTAVQMAKPQDVVILAGKGHERYEIDKGGKRPFDERKIVKQALGEQSF